MRDRTARSFGTRKSSQRSRAVFVLGMHRSGTSAITRGVAALGADLGGNFLETRFDNPTGYWEDKAIVALQDRLLASFGLSWEDPATIEDSRWNAPEVEPFVVEARKYLDTQFLARPLWAVKDPRSLRLLPFWRRVLEGLPVDDSYLLALRNPLSVADSLFRRQEMDHAHAHRLWLAYIVPHLEWISDRHLTVVDYDKFMDDPREQLKRVANQLKIHWSANVATDVNAYVRDFLNEELRHSRYSIEELRRSASVPHLGREVYLLLRRLATDEGNWQSAAFRLGWRNLALETQSFLGPP